MVAGSRDAEALAELAQGALRKKLPALRESLSGRFGFHHALLVGEILAKLDYLEEAIERAEKPPQQSMPRISSRAAGAR